MTRAELISRLASRFSQLTVQDAEASVKIILEAIGDSLTAGGRVEIRGFGVFRVHTRPPRLGRNPKTGERVPVPAKHVPHFKPGTVLRERVNSSVEMPNRWRHEPYSRIKPNSTTGEKIKISATTVPKFSTGAMFKQEVASKAIK